MWIFDTQEGAVEHLRTFELIFLKPEASMKLPENAFKGLCQRNYPTNTLGGGGGGSHLPAPSVKGPVAAVAPDAPEVPGVRNV